MNEVCRNVAAEKIKEMPVERVICACKNSLNIPIQRKSMAFFSFKPLVVFDDIELEFRGNPGGKFKSDVLMRKSTSAVST